MAYPQHLAVTTGKQNDSALLLRWIVLVSLVATLGVALLFGHAYDIKIFMATGYLVATGQNPYIAQDLTGVFGNSAFQGMTSIGYPPPWALILGLIYRLTYAWFPSLLLYNLAIKLPILAAVAGLAYVVIRILRELGVDEAKVQQAGIFMAISPFMIYFSAAWGQFDANVALLALLSLLLLYRGKTIGSAALLALAIAFKPTAIPLIPVAVIFLWGRSHRRALIFALAFMMSLLLFCVAPFIVFGWDPAPILQGWNAHFIVAGGMSFMTFFELLKDTYQLPGAAWLLGLIWLPVMAVVSVVAYRRGIGDFKDLLKVSTGFILVFFLTRAWLSEPNLMLLLPLALILTFSGELPKAALAALWVLPLIFTVFNNSPPQLLFPAFPEAMTRMLSFDVYFRDARLVTRILVVIVWQMVGWWLVVLCLKRKWI